MAINLEKKQKFDLTKNTPALKNVFVGLGWDPADGYNEEIDCDVSVFMVDNTFKIPEESFFIFYNNLKSGDGSVIHQGDNRTGEGEGDDECVNISLQNVNNQVEQMIFAVTIDEAKEKGQDFSNLDNSFIRICNNDNGEELCRFTLNKDFGSYDSVQIGRLFRDGDDWGFEAMGEPFQGGLATLVNLYT